MNKLRRGAIRIATYLGLAVLMIVVALIAIFVVSLAIDIVSGTLLVPIGLSV